MSRPRFWVATGGFLWEEQKLVANRFEVTTWPAEIRCHDLGFGSRRGQAQLLWRQARMRA